MHKNTATSYKQILTLPGTTMYSHIAALALAFTAFTQTIAAPTPGNGSVPLPNRLLHHWPNGTWVENISVRPNGNLLLTTSTPDGSVWQVKEPWTDNPEVEKVFNFDEWVDRLIGIGETTPDKYVVVGSRFYSTDAQSSHVARTFCAMELDFSKNSTTPSARLIAWMPESYLLQGVAPLPWDLETVLISDQYVLRPRQNQTDWTPSPGQIWTLNTRTGEYKLVMTDYAELNTTYAKGPDVGIDGIKIRDHDLFWVNQDNSGIYRIKINDTGAPADGAKPELIGSYETMWNDMAFDPFNKNLIWATGLNAVFAATLDGKIVPVDGVGTSDNLTLPGPTACQFGRTEHDKATLYVTGNLVEVPTNLLDVKLGGWVRALDTTGFTM
nr:hetero-Diels-Alderase [Phaeosphaeriaceae sp. CF-150626]